MKIVIDFTNGELRLEHSAGSSIVEVTEALQQAQLFYLRHYFKLVPKSKRKEFKAQAYDMVNYKMSAVLENFAPELEMRPDLTVEAIMKAENEILENEMSKMQKQPTGN